MGRLTPETKMRELEHLPELGARARFLMYGPGEAAAPDWVLERPISAVAQDGLSPEGILRGVNLLLERLESGHAAYYDVYSPEECVDDPQKADVNLLRLTPNAPDPGKPWALLCSGGAYQSVCTALESLPTAAHLLPAGYQVFALTYRVGGTNVLPKALEDVAAAIRFLRANADAFGLDPDRYLMAGWSAGGNLSVSWSARDIGWGRFGLSAPKALFAVYPVTDLEPLKTAPEHSAFLDFMLGVGWTQERLAEYDPARHVDGSFPPTYIVCGRDDATVPCVQSERLKALLDAHGVPAMLREVDHAPHGFGSGEGTDAEGWPEEAMAFSEAQS